MKICCAIKWHAELYCHSHKFGLLKYATCPLCLTHRLPFLPGMHFILYHCEYTWYMNVMNLYLYAWLWWSNLDIKMGNIAFYVCVIKLDCVIVEWGEIYKQSPSSCWRHIEWPRPGIVLSEIDTQSVPLLTPGTFPIVCSEE